MSAPTSTRSRTRNPRGEGSRLREDIVDSALALIEETGSADALSLRAIARGAGVTAPSIYAHFADLDEIIWAVVTQAFAELSAALRAATEGITDPVEQLHAGCHAYLAFAREHPQCYAVLFGRHGAEVTSISRDEFAGVSGAESFGILVDAVAKCAAAGRSDSTDAFADATAVWAGLHGYASLRANHLGFPWPEGDTLPDAMIDRLARITA